VDLFKAATKIFNKREEEQKSQRKKEPKIQEGSKSQMLAEAIQKGVPKGPI
jgi:hypothetical protein